MLHLSGQDWTDLERLHRDAYYFLLHRSLYRERISLLSCHPNQLNDWQTRRLDELNALNTNTGNSLDNL